MLLRAAAIEAAGPIDILVNNAGLGESAALTPTETTGEMVLDTNVKGMLLLAQAMAPRMQRGHGGKIINVASALGLRQACELVSYAVSKTAVIQLTRTLALEWVRAFREAGLRRGRGRRAVGHHALKARSMWSSYPPSAIW